MLQSQILINADDLTASRRASPMRIRLSRTATSTQSWQLLFVIFGLVLSGMCGLASTAPAQAQYGNSTAVGSESFDCVIEPHMLVRLASPMEGLVASVEADRGDRIMKGQVVAKLEASVEEANVALARAGASNEYGILSNRAKFELLRGKYGRAERLKNKNFMADAALEEAATEAKVAEQLAKEAELNLRIAQLELKRAEVLLEQRVIRSPIDGVVLERSLAPGEYRHAQSHILTIAQIDPLWVETFLPTAFHNQIRTGMRAEVEPEAPYDLRHIATVRVVDQVLDAASGTFGVRLELRNPDHRLPAGLKCKLRLLEGGQETGSNEAAQIGGPG